MLERRPWRMGSSWETTRNLQGKGDPSTHTVYPGCSNTESRIVGVCFCLRFCFFLFAFFPGSICLVFATVWKWNLSFCMAFGICYILEWSLCILHGICYIWPCSLSILHGICYILALQPLICMAFATFRYFKHWCGFLEGSLGFHLGFHLRFHLGFI